MSKIKLNEVVLSGFVADNIYTNQENTLFSFGLGVDDSYYKRDGHGGGQWENRTCWVNCRVFDKNRIQRLKEANLAKCEVVVTGKIKTSSYTDKEGKNVNQTFVLAERIQVVSEPYNRNAQNGNRTSGNNRQNNQQNYSQNYSQNSQEGGYYETQYQDDGYLNLDGIDEELPFN